MPEVTSFAGGINGALKTYYLPIMVNQINDEIIPLLQLIERNGEDIVGAGDIKIALVYGRHGGIGNRDENGNFPTPGFRRVVQATWETKNIFGIFQITDKMIDGAKGDKFALANVLEHQLETLITDIKDNTGRQCFGDGSGVLATCSTMTSAGTEVPVDNVQYFAEGMQVDILDESNSYAALQNGSNRTIIAVDRVNNKIKLEGTDNVQTAQNDVVTIAGNYGKELTGLDAVFKTSGNLYNLSRTTYPFLIPIIKSVNGGIDDLVIQAGLDTARILVGEEPDILLCSYGVARAFQYYLSARRMTLETKKLESGAEVLAYNDKTLIRDRYCQPGRMYQLFSKDWKFHQIDDWQWREEGGTVIQKLEGKPVSQAVLYKFCDLGCRRPGAQVLLENITEK